MDIKKIQKAIAASDKARDLLLEANQELRAHFKGQQLDIFYQESDGWVILSSNDSNTPLKYVDFKKTIIDGL